MRLSRLHRYLIVLIIAIGILVIETVGGLTSKSLSLLSDAFHVLTDIPAIMATFLAEYLVRKKNFHENTCRGRLGLVSALLLLIAGCGVCCGAYMRLQRITVIETHEMIAYTALGLLGNVAMWIFMKWGDDLPSAHQSNKHRHKNISHNGLLAHIITDFGQSIAVLVSGITMMYNERYVIDVVLSGIIGVIMIFWSVNIALTSWETLANASD